MKKVVSVLGIVLILVGGAGFFMPHLGGAHLSLAHNLIHIVSGAVALYFGLSATIAATRTFCFVFGTIYGLLGVAGFILGKTSERLLTIIPGSLELGRVDHLIHIVLGLVFIVLGFSARITRTPVPAS